MATLSQPKLGFHQRATERVENRGRVTVSARYRCETQRARLPARWRSLGFTLLELLVVVAIIGLLAAYVGPKYFGQLGKSEQALAKAQIESFHRALASYRLDVGSFPSSQEGLEALVIKPAAAAKWVGPYLSKAAPADPWGKPYIYRAPGTKGDYDLLSYGKDGQPGGSGDAADVGSD
jgi:general secretion pathway protein G